MPTRHLVLLGLMGTGKTSIGRRVADHLGWPLIDGDVWLERRTGGRTAADVATQDGLAALHRQEEQIAIDALAEPEPAVIGPAASVCESPTVRRLLGAHTLVWFTAPASYLAGHAAHKRHRPLLDTGDPVALFEEQIAAREPLMLPLAQLVIDVSTTSDDDAADAITALVAERP